ncbi:hypothetical protein D3C71_1521160 [compost metagenome]
MCCDFPDVREIFEDVEIEILGEGAGPDYADLNDITLLADAAEIRREIVLQLVLGYILYLDGKSGATMFIDEMRINLEGGLVEIGYFPECRGSRLLDEDVWSRHQVFHRSFIYFQNDLGHLASPLSIGSTERLIVVSILSIDRTRFLFSLQSTLQPLVGWV